ncbi:ATP-binding cassette domain-containing protein [Chelatococcus sp. SYSU_G07232]|uniref:ATP-binding cassette domain-containing protein n=1 Tax=Chelatococcus albus TaxID=3047466 RepID=A0ABT7AFB3_9HYPH|nr:ATP-binding cassette domain-containing protein [Chelatococcus sp. SYSU_G07232]MDJ1157539.1 ATP-binding cassette domain-containing protein [Chelatococcus sp. SYSU_G07232]
MFYAQLVVNGIVQGLVVGLAALAITLVFGIARFANAATGDAMTFGAYAALTAHKATGSLLLGSLSAVAATGVLSLAAYLAVFRNLANRSVVALLVASIGVGFVIRAALGVPLSRPIRFGEIAVNPLDLQLAGVAAVALAAVFAVLHLTPIGRQMRAVADDRDLARVSGIRPERVMVALWLFAGGERQQLAFARALMPRPKLMILDEPTAALSPAKVADSFTLIRRLPSLGVTVLVVERRARQSLTISDRGCILDGGRVALADEKAAELYFGRAAHA